AQSAGVKQRRGRAHVIEGREQAIELNRAVFFLLFLNRQAHSNTHEENLRQFNTGVVAVDEVAVVQGLQTEVSKLQVALGNQGFAHLFQIEIQQLRRNQLQFHAFL